MIDAQSIATRLDKCRCVGPGRYVACCPAHSDRNPSLAITDSDGKVLVYCRSGCSQQAVIAALRQLGLWSVEQVRHGAGRPYFSQADLLEIKFFCAIANADNKPLTKPEYEKLIACKAVLKNQGCLV